MSISQEFKTFFEDLQDVLVLTLTTVDGVLDGNQAAIIAGVDTMVTSYNIAYTSIVNDKNPDSVHQRAVFPFRHRLREVRAAPGNIVLLNYAIVNDLACIMTSEVTVAIYQIFDKQS